MLLAGAPYLAHQVARVVVDLLCELLREPERTANGVLAPLLGVPRDVVRAKRKLTHALTVSRAPAAPKT